MKKIILITTLTLLFFFFYTPRVKSVIKKCYLPPWFGCPSGYECYEIYAGQWPSPWGRKQGWEWYDLLVTDPGLHKYMIRYRLEVVVSSFYISNTSSLLMTGTHKVVPYHPKKTIGKYDFGTPTSPVRSGYIGISNATLYSPSVGYGWDSIENLESIDRDRGYPNDSRDLILSTSDHTFNIDVSNGDYVVELEIGDPGPSLYEGHVMDYVDIYAEDELKVDDLYEDWLTWPTFRVTVNDGQLNIRFHDDGGIPTGQ